MAVDDGAIRYVGRVRDARKLIGAETEVIDLDGKMMMPGMVDGHAHGQGFVACNMGFQAAPTPERSATS